MSGCHRDTVIIYYNAFFLSYSHDEKFTEGVAQQAPDLNLSASWALSVCFFLRQG